MKPKLIDRLHCALKGHDVKWVLSREPKLNGDNTYWVRETCTCCGKTFGKKERISVKGLRDLLADRGTTVMMDSEYTIYDYLK